MFHKKITKLIHKTYTGIEVFAKTIEYDEKKNPGENLDYLVQALERKKAERASAFHQGSFGVEEINGTVLEPVITEEQESQKKMPEQENKIDKELCPKGFRQVWQFEKLGGTKNDSNFIAVVHIDGNAMGKRVENFRKNHENIVR